MCGPKEEEIWFNRVSDGRIKTEQEVLIVPAVKVLMNKVTVTI
jgi:hypothetical protein